MYITKITDYISIDNLIVLMGIILAFYTTIYTTKKTIKEALHTEASWRANLFNVAATSEIGKEHLLCLRAHQRYSYANMDWKCKSYNCKYDKKFKYEELVRNEIGEKTYNLYEKYILCSNKAITAEDQIIIRDLAIAFLKFDFIKRGDNNCNWPLIGRYIDKRKREYEYEMLFNWILKYTRITKDREFLNIVIDLSEE